MANAQRLDEEGLLSNAETAPTSRTKDFLVAILRQQAPHMAGADVLVVASY
jgi:hypothetical protein